MTQSHRGNLKPQILLLICSNKSPAASKYSPSCIYKGIREFAAGNSKSTDRLCQSLFSGKLVSYMYCDKLSTGRKTCTKLLEIINSFGPMSPTCSYWRPNCRNIILKFSGLTQCIGMSSIIHKYHDTVYSFTLRSNSKKFHFRISDFHKHRWQTG